MASSGGVKPLGLSKLTEKVSSQAEEAKERGRAMLGHRNAYTTLQSRLGTLSDDMRHSVMVPFTSKAFMPGQLVHTNEILVLLGDNWFVETSAKHAAEIAGRRVAECDKMLQKIEEEVKLIEGWQKRAGDIGKEHDECVDIREEYEEDKEKEWKDKHKENVRKEKEKGTIKSKEDEDLWRRLEELEVQEALEKEWEDEESSEEEESESESEEEDSDIESDDNHDSSHDQKGLSFTNLGSADLDIETNPKRLGRRVSWAGVGDSEIAGNLIKFSHSSQEPAEERIPLESDNIPHTPSDLLHFTCQQPKSILKHTDAEILIREVPEDTLAIPDHEEDVLGPALQERVLERAVCDKPTAQAEEPKRVSKFKASRLKGK